MNDADLQSDIGKDLSAAWDAMEAAPENAAPEKGGGGVPAKHGEVEAIEKTLADEKKAEVKAKTPKAEPKAEKIEAKVDTKAEVKSEPEAKEPPKFEVPKSWPKEVRDRISTVKDPEDAKWVVEQYEFMKGEHERNKTAYAPAKLLAENLEQVLAPSRQQRLLNRMDDATYLKGLVAAEEFLQRDPQAGIRYLAEQYGVDLGKVNEQRQQEDPQVSGLKSEIQQLKQMVQQMTQGVQQSEEQKVLATVNSFADEVGPDGQKLRPYLDEVAEEMKVALAYQKANGKAPDLNAAYLQAIRMNEQVWLKVQQAKEAVSKKDAEAARLKEIEDAKRAAFEVRGSGVKHNDAPLDDLGAELRRNWDKLYA